MMKDAAYVGAIFGVVAAVLLGVALIALGWDRPPLEAVQLGYRGVAMEQVINPRTAARKAAAIQIPEAQDPAEPGGPTAGATYENLKVLGDVSQNEFDRLMLALTEWVAPEQGCNYCHNEENLAADDVYTKVVSRRMVEMTQHINTKWKDHVGDTGVTCFTCHAGKPQPANTWTLDPGQREAGGMAATRTGQNLAKKAVGVTSLPFDPFAPYLAGEGQIRVIGGKVLPTRGELGPTIVDTEATYGLMMHISEALGVNCTYCHNSRSFFAWDQSAPARTTAYHGLAMVRDLNANFMDPLKPSFPTDKLGPKGDVSKVNCATCHQGLSKPLNGANMLKDYLVLSGAEKN